MLVGLLLLLGEVIIERVRQMFCGVLVLLSCIVGEAVSGEEYGSRIVTISFPLISSS